MPLPLLGLAAGLLGGGAPPLIPPPEPPAPVTQTVTTGAISLGSKYLGRGGVSAVESTTSASGEARVTAPAANNLPVYAIAGAAVVVVAILAMRGKG